MMLTITGTIHSLLPINTAFAIWLLACLLDDSLSIILRILKLLRQF